MSNPEYRIIQEVDVPAKMRDGTTLFADVYRPDAEGKFPVLRAFLDSNELVISFSSLGNVVVVG